MTTRIIEPTTITTREEVSWEKSYADYPATLWQLNYYFRSNLGVGFTAAWGTEVVADGTDFVITVPASKTDDMTVAGWYTWQAWLTEIADSTNKKMIGSGRVRVVLGFDPASTAIVETRSQAKQICDAINAAMLTASSSTDTIEYEISTPAGSRRVKKSKKEAMDLLDHYTKIVARENANERIRRGKGVYQTTVVRLKDA